MKTPYPKTASVFQHTSLLLAFLITSFLLLSLIQSTNSPSQLSALLQSNALSATTPTCAINLYYNSLLDLCILCPIGCLSCCDENLCEVCQSGYILSTKSGVCLACGQRCASCTEQLKCLTCQTGANLVDSYCLGCPTGCQSCTTPSTCQTCKQAYHPTTNGCGPCPPGCKLCSFSTSTGYTCTSCYDKYFVDGTKCSKCVAPCKLCTTAIACVSCQTSFYLPTVGATNCVACQTNCFSCVAGSPNPACDTCNDGFLLGVPGSSSPCSACPSNCKKCSSSILCLTCYTGYSLMSGNCVLCQSPCSECDSSGKCLSCLPQYYLLSPKTSAILASPDQPYRLGATTTSQCLPCLSQCNTCTSPSLCSQCRTGAYFNGIGCVSCGIYCRQCASNGACTKCLQGYSIYGTTCVPCVDGNICQCAKLMERKIVYKGSARIEYIVAISIAIILIAL